MNEPKMALEDVKKCNFCCSLEYRYFTSKDGFDLVKCRGCGLIYVNPRPTKESLNKLYNSNYFLTGKGHEGYVQYVNDRGELNENSKGFMIKRFNVLKEIKKSGGKILDVGCAHGFFLNEVKNCWDPYGVEMSNEAVKFAKSKLNLVNVLQGDFHPISKRFPKESFDIITMWELLDHIPDPNENLQRAYQLLKRGGVLGFNISSTDSFRRIINGKDWRPIKPPEHLYNYSLRVVKNQLKKIGFTKFIIKGKNEVGIRHIIGNPDLNRTNMLEGRITHYKFKYSYLKWFKLYIQAIFCYLSEKLGISSWTIGSAIDIYAIK